MTGAESDSATQYFTSDPGATSVFTGGSVRVTVPGGESEDSLPPNFGCNGRVCSRRSASSGVRPRTAGTDIVVVVATQYLTSDSRSTCRPASGSMRVTVPCGFSDSSAPASFGRNGVCCSLCTAIFSDKPTTFGTFTGIGSAIQYLTSESTTTLVPGGGEVRVTVPGGLFDWSAPAGIGRNFEFVSRAAAFACGIPTTSGTITCPGSANQSLT